MAEIEKTEKIIQDDLLKQDENEKFKKKVRKKNILVQRYRR